MFRFFHKTVQKNPNSIKVAFLLFHREVKQRGEKKVKELNVGLIYYAFYDWREQSSSRKLPHSPPLPHMFRIWGEDFCAEWFWLITKKNG